MYASPYIYIKKDQEISLLAFWQPGFAPRVCRPTEQLPASISHILITLSIIFFSRFVASLVPCSSCKYPLWMCGNRPFLVLIFREEFLSLLSSQTQRLSNVSPAHEKVLSISSSTRNSGNTIAADCPMSAAA